MTRDHQETAPAPEQSLSSRHSVLAADPIFIVGAARSGTTWVYDILTSHPNVAGVFESWLFTDNGLKRLFSETHWPARFSGLGRLLQREQLAAHVREFALNVMSHALEPGMHFLVEKSPSHLFSLPIISEVFPSARVIHVLRDGRDVAVSVRAAARSWEPSWMRSFGRSVADSARSWKHAVRHVRRDGAALGNRFMEIRYETIHADPIAAYETLYAFCGLPYDSALLKSVFDATDFSRNYKPNEKGFRRGGRVGDHRRHLNLTEQLAFFVEGGKVLVETGYLQDSTWLRVLETFSQSRINPYRKRR